MMDELTRTWVVDRVDGRTLVLVEDGSGRTVEIARATIAGNPAVGEGGQRPPSDGPAVGEGAVLRVPVAPDGRPIWAEAVLDEAERRARIEEAERALDELKRRDPGGDIAL